MSEEAGQQAQRFRKKPVVIEARQLPGDVDWRSDATHEIAYGLAEWCGGTVRFGYLNGEPYPRILIATLEGEMRADPGNWIIKGVAGEFYPCREDVFAETYEPAELPADGAESGQERDSSPAPVSQDPGTLTSDPGAAESYPTSFAEFAVCWGAEDPNDCAGPIAGDAGLLVYEDEEEASRMTQWIGNSYVARCKVTRGRWERVEGSPF